LEPTPKPTPEPTAEPTAAPTQKPTGEPTAEPTGEPTPEPTLGETYYYGEFFEEEPPNPSKEPTAMPTQQPTPVPTLETTPPPTYSPGCAYEVGIYGTDDCPPGRGFAHIYDTKQCELAANNIGYQYRGMDTTLVPEHDDSLPRGCYVKSGWGGRQIYFNGPRSMTPAELRAYWEARPVEAIASDRYAPACGKCPSDTPEPPAAPTPVPTLEPSSGFGGCPETGLDPAAQRGTHQTVTEFATAPPAKHENGQLYAHYCGGIAVDTCNRIYWGEIWMNQNEDGDSAVYRFPTDRMSPMPVDMIHKEQLFPKYLVGWGLAVHQFGMNKPRFIVLRPGNWIYSCDYQRVFKFQPGDWQAVLVAGGQGEGNEDNQIGQCEAIAFDEEDRFYVSDSWNNRVNRYLEGDHTTGSGTADATLVAGPMEKQDNERVKIAGVYIQPRGNAILSDGSVLVVCRASSRVIRWQPNPKLSPDEYSSRNGFGYHGGEVVAGANGHGCGPHQLNRPHGLATYGNTMYIMDTQCNRVQEWHIGDQTGTMIAGTGKKGHWDPLTNGYAVAEDQIQYGEIIIFNRGWLYITDASKDRIVRWGTGLR
jgi:hypothetical protein